MSVDAIKNDLTSTINKKIKDYSSIIIDSFVEFYGKEYRPIIMDRFNNISYLYYITDLDIFYIAKELPKITNEEYKNIIFTIPYITYLLQNKFYKQKVTPHNFYELGLNKIIGASSNDLFSKNLSQYSIALALRDDNENSYEVNIPMNNDIKRIIALPIFAASDKNLFHELNHAICSQMIFRDKKPIIKCGLEYEDMDKLYIYEIINDKISLEIYDIFKSKCRDKILNFNILSKELTNVYENYHYLIDSFYEHYKEKLKLSSIDNIPFQIVGKDSKQQFKDLSSIIENKKSNKK